MQFLNGNSKYLAVVNSDDVAPESVNVKLEAAGIAATVLGIPGAARGIEFYELVEVSKVMKDSKMTDTNSELVEALKEELESEEVQNDQEAKTAMESALKKAEDQAQQI